MSAERILVLDDDEAIAQFVADALAVVHFECTQVHNPTDAIVEAKNGRFKLVISDIDLPGMNGFQCRDRIRQIPRYGDVPFLFMSSADSAIEQVIARNLGRDKLLIKPFKPADLRRTVFGLLEPVNAETGSLPAALSPILERVSKNSESGVLTAVQGTIQKRIVFQSGKIVFAASNDPRDLIGQALLRSGFIKEKDLLDAFSMSAVAKDSSGTPFLAAALTALRKVTPEQTHSVFVGKIRESVLDVFLWFDGAVEYVAGAIENSDAPFPVTLDTDEVRAEGERRREKWRRVMQVLPDQSVSFKRVGAAWPDEIARSPGDKLLVKLIEKELSMAQILVELRGQDYAVGVRLATLVLQKIIKMAPAQGFRPMKPVKVDTVPDGQTLQVTEGTFAGIGSPRVLADEARENIDVPEESDVLRRLKGTPREEPVGTGNPEEQMSAVAVILTRGLAAFRLNDLTTARAAFEEVLSREPMNALARQRITEVDAAAADLLRKSGLTNDARVALAVAPSRLAKQQIPANDAFVLNRLAAGDRTIGELLQLCPMTEREVLSVVQRYLKQQLLVRKS